MPTTEPRRRTVARDQLATAYQPDPTVCRCKPVTVATFRAEQLAEVERRHMRAQGCHHPAEPVDAAAYVGKLLIKEEIR